jgi:hypothetical protein
MGHQAREVQIPGGTVTISGAPGLRLPPGELNHSSEKRRDGEESAGYRARKSPDFHLE